MREHPGRAEHGRRDRDSDRVGATGRPPGRRGSADWFTMTAGGLMVPDVRLAIRTGDDAVVLVRYSGRLRFVPGQESIALIAAVFETGDPRYQ